ncbi:MAG: hypothetical protein AB1489_13345 [Acidobacteriota bacterium]
MKKVGFLVLVLGLMGAFTLISIKSAAKVNAQVEDENASIQAQIGGRDFSIQLTGSVVQPGVATPTPIALVGRFTMNNDGTAVGSRTLVTPAGPIPGGDFTCTTPEFNRSTGVGKLACVVKDATTPPDGRLDTFRFVVTDNGREMQLVLIDGVPGAVVSGVAKRQ